MLDIKGRETLDIFSIMTRARKIGKRVGFANSRAGGKRKEREKQRSWVYVQNRAVT